MKRLRSARLLLGPIAMLLRAFATFEVWLTFSALRRPAMKRIHLLMHLFDRIMKLLGVVMQLSCLVMKPLGAGDAPLRLRPAGNLRGSPWVITMAKDFAGSAASVFACLFLACLLRHNQIIVQFPGSSEKANV